MRKPVGQSTRHHPEKHVTFYTRPGCSLCEKALVVVNRVRGDIPFHLEISDISGNPGLLRKYALHIPVVSIDGVEVFRFRVDEKLFRSRLAGCDA